MDVAREKLVSVLGANQARYSCPELAQMLRLSGRQVRYALDKLQDQGYEVSYVKKKVCLSKKISSFRYDEASSRQFYLLCWLASYNWQGCEESVIIDRLETDLGVHKQTVARDLEFLSSENYIEKQGNGFRLSRRLIAQGFLNKRDIDRLIQLVFSFGARLDKPELIQSILYKLIMLHPGLQDYSEQKENLSGRMYFLGGEAVEDEAVTHAVSIIRTAILNNMLLKTAKGEIQPLQMFFSKPTGVWYLAGRRLPKTRVFKFRVSNLGEVSVVQAQHKLPAALDKARPAPEQIELEVYPDYSEQKKILYQLVGLNSVRAYWQENGSMRVIMAGEHREDFIRWLRVFGPSVKVIRPEHLSRQLLHSAERVALQHSD